MFLPINTGDVGQRVSELVGRKEEGITHSAHYFLYILASRSVEF